MTRTLEVSEINLRRDDRKALDECIRRVASNIAHKAINKSKLGAFAINAIWIRSYVCGMPQQDSWDDLRKITSLKFIENNREEILTFMELREYNTLILTSIALPDDLAIIFRTLRDSAGQDRSILIRAPAMQRLQMIYERNKLTDDVWKDKFGELKELSILNLIGQLTVSKYAKKDIVVSVIKSASFESMRSYQKLQIIFSSLSTQNNNHDMIKHCIEDSIYNSLTTKFKPLPDLEDVSILLHNPIGWSLANESGWEALMTFLGRKEVTSSKTDSLINMFADVYERFANSEQWFEQKRHVDLFEKTILGSMQVSKMHFDLAVSAFQVAGERHNIFASQGNYTLCARIAKIIIDQTGLVSTVRSTPYKLTSIPSFQLRSSYGESLIDCLRHELVRNLNIQCSMVDNAVSFCSKIPIESQLATDISSNVLLSSFSSWNPSTMEDLLSLDASTLAQLHKLLIDMSPRNESKAQQNIQLLNLIATKWMKQYAKDGYDAVHLTIILRLWTDEKQVTLGEVFNKSFPTKADLRKKLSEFDEVIQSIRSRLAFRCMKNDLSSDLSIRDVAVAYQLKNDRGTLLSRFLLYFEQADPVISLARLYSDKAKAESLVEKHERELHAAVYFSIHKSVLFLHELGSSLDMELEEFLKKLEYAIEKIEMLLSPEAKYSLVSEAALAIEKENAIIENELNIIKSTPNITIGDDTSQVHLQHSMTVSCISKPLKNFISCCTAYNFSFVTADGDFAKLTRSSEQLDNGVDSNIEECNKLGEIIADLMTPKTESLNITARLNSLLPVFRFFDALRFCSSTVTLAKERAWFGDEGLKTFYKEYGNVSNMFTSNQESFENEILDRLEPTMRIISFIGEAFNFTSVAEFVETFKCHNDILKVEEMRLIQSNICKIQV